MNALADASLSDLERSVLDGVVELFRAELGPDLHGIWLYGSRTLTRYDAETPSVSPGGSSTPPPR